MNYVKEALLEGEAKGKVEGELIGKVKLCKYNLEYTLDKTVELLHKENKSKVISIYNEV